MEALDLTQAPPRAPHAQLDGLIFLPRSIDKARATLPGGDPGAYRIEGFTQRMLDTLGVSREQFVTSVGAAADDAEVAAFLRAHADPAAYAAWNAFISRRAPSGGNRTEAEERYPWLASRPDIVLALDVLEEDDKLSFAARR
jgi:hypothetical protein